MGISKGNVSQSAVLSDLDLGAGSFRQRAVLNRAGKTGGNMSLSDHRGVACAPQLIVSGGWNNQPTSSNQGYARYFPTEYNETPKGTIATFPSGNAVFLTMQGGAMYGNSTSEHITPFKVTEGGTYRLTGSVSATEHYPGAIGISQHQVAVVSSSSNYFSGTQVYDIVLNGTYLDGSGWENRTYNNTFSLTTSRPYACLILYCISFSPGYENNNRPIATATYRDMRIKKE